MKRKILLLVINIMIFAFVMSGCTSLDGIRISKAVTKSLDNKSVQSDVSLSLKVKTEGMEISSDTQKILDMINSSTIKLLSKNDIENSYVDASYTFDTNGVSLNGKLYSDGQKMWLKLPLEDKYLEYDSLAVASTDEEKQLYINLQKEIKPLAINFVKQYIYEYKYKFNNLTNKGNATVTTPQGQVNVTNYEVRLDKEELLNLIKYTVNNLSESTPLKQYIMGVIEITIENNPEMLEGQSKDEFLAVFGSQYDAMISEIKANPEQVDQIISMIDQYFDLGPSGYIFTISIDENDNIVKVAEVFDFIIKYGMGKIHITLQTDSINYNINNVDVKIPTFSQDQVIGFDEYFNSPAFTDSEVGKSLGLNKKQVILSIGDKRAYANDNETTLDAEPYIKDESTMVPVRFIGESLGAKVDWREIDRSIIYNDGEREIIMQIGSKLAYVDGILFELPTEPEINNGRAMVPLRFVSEHLGASVEWNEEYRTIFIEKE